jgi:hypothetical protein
MKKKIFLFIFLFSCFCLPAYTQNSGENYPLVIAIVGTTNYNDVSTILKNLKRSSQVSHLTISLSSKGLIELSGSYHGERDSLVDEVRGLAQDRFSLELQKQKGKQTSNAISITLRKLTPQASSS